jgi:hypothetical protein
MPTGKSKRRIAAAVLLAYVLVMSFGGCADRILLQPSRETTETYGAQRRFVNAYNTSIEVFTARSPGAIESGRPRAYVLDFCGRGARAEYRTRFLADSWRDRPVEVWVMNYPGSGQTNAPAKLKSIWWTALATYDELAKEADGRPIFITGNSFGTTAALWVATQRPAAGMILRGPPPLRRLILERHGWWNLWLAAGPIALQVPWQLNCMVTAPDVDVPAIFLESMLDETVPAKYQQRVIDAYGGPKRVIRLETNGHKSPIRGEDERRLQEAMDWLWQQAVGEEYRARQ